MLLVAVSKSMRPTSVVLSLAMVGVVILASLGDAVSVRGVNGDTDYDGVPNG